MLIFEGLIYFAILCTVKSSLFPQKHGFTIQYQWSLLDFDYPSPYERQLDIQSGNFIPGIPAPIDTDVYYSDDGPKKIFVTIPRFQAGIPVALGTISPKSRNENPLIIPYPSWSWYRNSEGCPQNRIVSVYRVAIDECGRLWVLDTGRLIDTIICPPQVLVFDLKTDNLLHRYEIPSNQIESRSVLVTPVIEVLSKQNQCQNTFAYLADCQTYSIIVYDFKRDTSWRITDKTMYPHPDYGTYTIQGESFELMDGVLGMSLSPRTDGQRKLFYHAMSSPSEHWVYTYHLRNNSMFSNGTPPRIFNTFAGKRRSQVPAEAIDSNGVMYFGLVNEVQIACFNTRAGEYGSLKTSDIIADNPLTLQFASGVKVIQTRNGEEELWIVTSRFQKVATGSLNTREINFRIQAAKIPEIIRGTQCASNLRPPGIQFQHQGGYGFYDY